MNAKILRAFMMFGLLGLASKEKYERYVMKYIMEIPAEVLESVPKTLPETERHKRYKSNRNKISKTLKNLFGSQFDSLCKEDVTAVLDLLQEVKIR